MSKQQHSALYDRVKETYFSRLRTEEANVLISRITSLYLNMMETEREKDGAAIFGQITSMNSFPYYEYVDAMGEDGFERFVSYLLTITQDQLDELLAECWRGNEASSTPVGIVELVNALYPMSSDASVLDLCAGQANFLWNRHELYPGNELFGLEIDPSILEITRRYFSTKGIPCQFRLGDALNENPFLLDNKTFDLVFTNFPFGLRGTEGLFADEQRYKLNFYSNPKDSSWQFIKAALNLMDEAGKVIAIMTPGNLFRKTEEGTRRDLLEQGLVEAVIELPKQLFVESAIPVALVVFSFGNETVRFVNLADCYTETRGLNVMDVPKALTIWNEADGRSVIEVDRSAILANDAILIAKKYLANNLLPDVDSVPLGDLCLDLFRGAQLSSRVLNDIAVDENNADRAVLTLASLDEVLINDHREYIKTTDRNYDRYLIQDNDILITSRGTAQRINLAHLKPDEQVIASGNLIVLRPDPEQVHPLYVYAVLASDIGRTLLASVTKEGTIASIDPNGLRSIRIPMIDEEKQYQVAHKIERLTDRFRSLQRELIETSSRITTLFDQESMEE